LGKGVAEFKNGLKDETQSTDKPADIADNNNPDIAQPENEKSQPIE
jgi:Sec-independent protein translocase protein TatA